MENWIIIWLLVILSVIVVVTICYLIYKKEEVMRWQKSLQERKWELEDAKRTQLAEYRKKLLEVYDEKVEDIQKRAEDSQGKKINLLKDAIEKLEQKP